MVDVKVLKNIASSFTVLYVEDDKDIARTVVNYLSKFFKEVIYANSGEEGLEHYKQSDYDIVISDINMPKMNGLEMARQIKKINKNQSIIFITAYSESDIFIDSIKIGVDGYIIKPINYNEINELLYKLCINMKNSFENNINVEQQKCLMEHISQKNTLLKQYTEVIDKVAIVSKTDLKGNIIYVNDFFCEIAGYKKDELLGKSHNIVRHPDMASSVYSQMWSTIQKGKVWEGTIKNKAKDGSAYFVHATILPMYNQTNEIDSYMGIRFLSTSEELEKREFKKKVRGSFQEYKKINHELSIRVDHLDKELADKSKIGILQEGQIKDLNTRLQTALSQITHYEKSFSNNTNKKYDALEHYSKNLTDMTTKFKNASSNLDKTKIELSKTKADNESKKKEVLKLNEELIKQRNIIKDLRDTIKNINEAEEEAEKTKSTSLFDKLKIR